MFHAWRSFNVDENTETIDVYATQIRQVATLLGYGEPQILESLTDSKVIFMTSNITITQQWLDIFLATMIKAILA